MKTVSKYHPLQHYTWGDNCDGWNLVEEPSFSVKQERMPAGTAETLHLHKEAQQFFFILKGVATFQIDQSTIIINAGEGIHVPPGTPHKISNEATVDLEFILCSQPATKNDRMQCD